jgi:hypothetical protein
MKQLFSAALFTIAALFIPAAMAHGDAKPKQGGVVASAGDLSFELVATADGAALFIEDHGKPLASVGVTGKLTVLTGADKAEGEFKPAGDNKLTVSGIKLASGAKAMATLNGTGKKPLTVRFTIK